MDRTQDDFERTVEERLGGTALTMDLDAFQAIWLLHEAAIVARRRVEDQALRAVDLNWTQFEVLWHLWLFREEEMRHVADATAMSKGSLTDIVSALSRRGLVTRRPGHQDRRTAFISITLAGEELIAQVLPAVNSTESLIVADVSASERSALITSLRSIVFAARGKEPNADDTESHRPTKSRTRVDRGHASP
jgi:MarR family 2-MHQ and catechol resistance regulon transcriptional repressor